MRRRAGPGGLLRRLVRSARLAITGGPRRLRCQPGPGLAPAMSLPPVVPGRGFPAGPGYDLVTGLGTIDAAKFVPDLVRLAQQEAA
ncbi:MAG TPA: hypothetical protein VGQ05_12080 [Streptosporangiaceae bacterium]|nr:hypothetical protein [Streptosporangiaceae bacterium]